MYKSTCVFQYLMNTIDGQEVSELAAESLVLGTVDIVPSLFMYLKFKVEGDKVH